MWVRKARGFAPLVRFAAQAHQRHSLWNPIVWWRVGGDVDLTEVHVPPYPPPNERVLRASPLAGVQGAEPLAFLANARTP